MPGYYLTAGFANEGIADWWFEDRLLDAADAYNLGKFLNGLSPGYGQGHDQKVMDLYQQSREFQEKALAVLKTRKSEIEAKIAALEAGMTDR